MPNESIDIKELFLRICAGDRFALGKGITLVESQRDVHRESAIQLLELASSENPKSIRIAITGAPGVGKSTFIEKFGLHIIQLGKRVAVLAVDPSSQISKGSILGDKTRMDKLSTEPKAFIRPSPSGTTAGGVAQRTRESIQLCEAAGYDVILVETVGVGQSEYQVSNMVDFFMLLLMPGAGDALQGIKRGIVEMADLIIVNKADGKREQMAKQTKAQFQNALHFFPARESGWYPKIILTSSIEGKGIDSCWKQLQSFLELIGPEQIADKRKHQNLIWFNDRLSDWMKTYLMQNELVLNTLTQVQDQLINESISVSKAIHLIQNKIKTIVNGGT